MNTHVYVDKNEAKPTDEIYLNGQWVLISAIGGDSRFLSSGSPIRRKTQVPSGGNSIKRVISFPVFQAHCDERKFIYAGEPGRFNVACRMPGGDKCNVASCPVWNSDRVETVHAQEGKSLAEINMALKSGG